MRTKWRSKWRRNRKEEILHGLRPRRVLGRGKPNICGWMNFEGFKSARLGSSFDWGVFTCGGAACTEMGGGCCLHVVKQVVFTNEAGLPQHTCRCYATGGLVWNWNVQAPQPQMVVPCRIQRAGLLNISMLQKKPEAWVLCEVSWFFFWFTFKGLVGSPHMCARLKSVDC